MSKTIWLVQGTCGEYSDRDEWIVAWCATEADANMLRDRCTAAEASLTEEERHDWYSNKEIEASRKAKLSVDPHYRSDYTGTRYGVFSVEGWAP